MKKLIFILLCATFVACNKNTTTDAKAEVENHSVVWASTVRTFIPLVQDTTIEKSDWDELNKYDKKTIFESVKSAVLKGKLKAYYSYPGTALSLPEFNEIIKDINSDDLIRIFLDEKVELDTTNYTLNKKVTTAAFTIYKKVKETGEILGYKVLFQVKFNDEPVAKKD